MYWLTGLPPATCRIWLQAINLFASIQLKRPDNLERICMDNHWDLFIDIPVPRTSLIQQFWVAGMYYMAKIWGWTDHHNFLDLRDSNRDSLNKKLSTLTKAAIS